MTPSVSTVHIVDLLDKCQAITRVEIHGKLHRTSVTRMIDNLAASLHWTTVTRMIDNLAASLHLQSHSSTDDQLSVAADGRASRHCTAGQYGYVPSGQHLLFTDVLASFLNMHRTNCTGFQHRCLHRFPVQTGLHLKFFSNNYIV